MKKTIAAAGALVIGGIPAQATPKTMPSPSEGERPQRTGAAPRPVPKNLGGVHRPGQAAAGCRTGRARPPQFLRDHDDRIRGPVSCTRPRAWPARRTPQERWGHGTPCCTGQPREAELWLQHGPSAPRVPEPPETELRAIVRCSSAVRPDESLWRLDRRHCLLSVVFLRSCGKPSREHLRDILMSSGRPRSSVRRSSPGWLHSRHPSLTLQDELRAWNWPGHSTDVHRR